MYQALYRKWRPKTFSQVVGQDHITGTLQRQVADGQVGHAYLFTGVRGTGKTTSTRGSVTLLERMGLTRNNLMACGDGLNDCSMIAYAGVGVAMQNAEQPVKDAAVYVTAADNNHDGVAEAVEKFILREE